MNWAKFLIYMFRTILIWAGIAALALGVIGYLFAGMEGLKNGAAFGFVFGLAGGFLNAGVMIYAFYWGDFAGRYGTAWLDEQTRGKDPDKHGK